MKKYIILFAIILFYGFSFAQSTDAVYKKIKKEYTFQTDGSIEYRYQKELKLNTHYSFNRMFGETFIVYNPDFQKLIIHDSYTIMANGKKIETPKNAFNEVLPRAAANYPAYNQMREMVVTHTALEVGATIYLDYSIVSKPNFIKEMLKTELMAERVPIDHYELILKVPARRNLKFTLLNSNVKPTEYTDGKYRSYKWNFQNLKAISYEPASPPYFETAPTLIFSTFPNFETNLKAFTNQKAFKETKFTEADQLIKDLKKSTFSEKELSLALQKYIVNNIAFNHIPGNWNNYQLEDAEQVWKANIGSQIEKTALLWKTLKSAGLNADIIGFYPLALWKAPTQTIDHIDAFGVIISFKDGERIILSANTINGKTLELNYPNHLIINIITGKTINPISLMNHPAIHLNAQLTIDPGNQIYGQMNLKLEGALLDNIALSQDTQKIKTYFSSPIPFSEKDAIKGILNKDLKGDLQIIIKGDAELRQQENYYFWTIPHINNGIAKNHFNTLVSQRDFPLVVPAIEEEYQYDITLPKSVNWIGPEVHISYKENFGEMHINIALKDGRVKVSKYLKINPDMLQIRVPASRMDVYSRDFQLNNKSLTTEEYRQFRKMMIDWYSERANELVFKR